MTLDDSIQGFRLRVVTDAHRSGNVSATCRRYGISRTPFYRWRQRLDRYGPEGLHPKRRTARPGRPPQVSVVAERRVVAEALAWPTRGPRWVSARLAREGLEVAPTTVWRVLHRHGLGTRRERLAVLEHQSAVQVGLLTERTKPRQAWTNGFVERLQGTILHEHWRVAFRRQHFTRLRQLQRSLDGFLRFYNTQRPHQGYRLHGQTPVTVFAGAVAA